MTRNTQLWVLWSLATLIAGAVLVVGMLYGGQVRAMFLIGQTTAGHHQIEMVCESCHTDPFGGGTVIQDACVNCHGADLKESKDSHPKRKFTNPRNADRLEKLKATECITCHTEHRPEITHAMGVTLPTDYCELCHATIGEDRPSHMDLPFSGCADAGCHNYHDNRALYEDYLERHADQPAIAETPVIGLIARAEPPVWENPPLTAADQADAPQAFAPGMYPDAGIIQADWLGSRHAEAGVNCGGCHAPGAEGADAIAAAWVEKPGMDSCRDCHGLQVTGFSAGRHGMRLAGGLLSARKVPFSFGLLTDQPLGPMQVTMARLPMRPDAAETHTSGLTCNTCHPAHRYDIRQAAAETCLTCHDDGHSRSWEGSPHQQLWVAELAGDAPAGSGVSCATCHMPRIAHEDPNTWVETVMVQHNQNVNLRPNEKMIRSVCMDCHGLGFAIDALADPQSIATNFNGQPSVHVESIDWVMRRKQAREGSR